MENRYLDHNATSPLHPEVAAAMAEALRESAAGGTAFGNPSSQHWAGRAARRRLEDARESAARLIGASAHEIYFTGGGTEANNALRGILASEGPRPESAPRRHIVTSSFEHPSLLETAKVLEAQGFSVTYVDPDGDGVVRADAVEAALRPDTALVSIMAANNEVGSLQPIAEIAARVRARGALFHTDAVQILGKADLDLRAVDYASFSAHKINGPKGVGALFARKGAPLKGFLVGGPQERAARGGTENVIGIAGFGAAAELWRREGTAERERLRRLRDTLESELRARVPDLVVNCARAERLPNTLNVTLPACRGDLMVMGLDMRGIAVSAGSACASGSVKYSHVILAMGKGKDAAASSLRFSVGLGNTEPEMAEVAAAVAETAAGVRGA